jgi:hypothetical protein
MLGNQYSSMKHWECTRNKLILPRKVLVASYLFGDVSIPLWIEYILCEYKYTHLDEMCAEILWNFLIVISTITKRGNTSIKSPMCCEISMPRVSRGKKVRTISGLWFQLPIFSSTDPPASTRWARPRARTRKRHTLFNNRTRWAPFSSLLEHIAVKSWANHGSCWSFDLLPDTSTECRKYYRIDSRSENKQR